MSQGHRRWPRVLAGIASALVLTATGMAGVGAVAYNRLSDNISTQDVSRLLNRAPLERAAEDGKPLNILVMGSDTRAGENDLYGDPTAIGGARSDTTILVHVSADRTRAMAVSIPRDSIVDIPSCPQWNDQRTDPSRGRFNEAFANAGPVCTILTVEKLSGVKIDHFMVVDFTGFKGVVDALDGVEVCLKQPVDDPLSGLKLPAGVSTVKGEDALAFVRARYTLGDGSDISRIDRQQAFLASAIRKATSTKVLANPLTTYQMLDATTKSLLTDPGLNSLDSLQRLALSMSDMKPSDVTFLTVPFAYNDDGSTVTMDPAQSAQIWAAVRNDTPWPPPTSVPSGQADPLTASPSQIYVQVLNGTGVAGQATKVADALKAQGYQVVNVGDYTSSTVTKTSVLYPTNGREDGRTLGYALNTTDIRQDTADAGISTVIVGSDYSGVRPVVVASPSASPTPTPEVGPSAPASADPRGRSADTVVCS